MDLKGLLRENHHFGEVQGLTCPCPGVRKPPFAGNARVNKLSPVDDVLRAPGKANGSIWSIRFGQLS